MNDIEYMLRQDQREKKSAGRGIYHKRNGSKTKYVGLPQDKMTHAEWKRRNGPVATYNISTRLDWRTFKKLPADLKKTYIDALTDNYMASRKRIANSLGVTPQGLSAHLTRAGITVHFPFKGIDNDGVVSKYWPDFLDGRYTIWHQPLLTDTAEPEAHEDTAPESTVHENTLREDMRYIRDGETFVVNDEPHTADGDSHLCGDPDYDGHIVYDRKGNSFLEEDFPENAKPENKPGSIKASELHFCATGTADQLLDLIVAVLADDLTDGGTTYELRFGLRKEG